MVKRFFTRFSSVLINRSLRAKVTLGIIFPMVVMLCIFTFVEYTHYRSVLMNKLSHLAANNGELVEETLRHSMQESDFTEVQQIIDVVGRNTNFRSVYILDSTGRVIYSPKGKSTGTQLDIHEPSCQACHKLPASEWPSGVVVEESDGQRVFRSMHPIKNGPDCTQCHDPQQKLIGMLLTDISVKPFEAAIITDLRENLLLWGSGILISAIIVYLAMGSLVIRRLEKVANALAGFGKGERDLRLVTSSKDEIGQLEADFNEMGQRIQVEEAANRLLSEDLRQQTVQQQGLLKRLINAQEDERKRMARELHDQLGQSLSGLALHSEVIDRFLQDDPGLARKQLALVRELIGSTTEQMYELILALRPSVLDDLGLAAALRAHAERVFDGCNVTFSLESSELAQRLPPLIETTLYRTFQEALNNVVKHSAADQVSIRLARRDGFFEGEIMDNGRGFDLANAYNGANNPHGLGLMGMQERVTLCGGSLEIFSEPGKGTRIQIRIPMVELKDE